MSGWKTLYSLSYCAATCFCPVSVDLAVVAIELAADGLASESQSSWRRSVPNGDPALLRVRDGQSWTSGTPPIWPQPPQQLGTAPAVCVSEKMADARELPPTMMRPDSFNLSDDSVTETLTMFSGLDDIGLRPLPFGRWGGTSSDDVVAAAMADHFDLKPSVTATAPRRAICIQPRTPATATGFQTSRSLQPPDRIHPPTSTVSSRTPRSHTADTSP